MSKRRPSADQLYHAFHHNFTTKTPRPAHHFSQKPQQKRPCTTDKKNLSCRGAQLLLFLSQTPETLPWVTLISLRRRARALADPPPLWNSPNGISATL